MKKTLLFAAFMFVAALLFSQNKVQVKLENPDQQFFELIEKKGLETIAHHEGEYIVFLCDYQNFINLRKEDYHVRTLRPDRSTVNHVSLPARDDERRGNDQRSAKYRNTAERHRAQKYYEQNRLTDGNASYRYPIKTNPFRSTDCGTVTDYDENVYNTVLMGDQCWMQSNLQTTHYDNGDAIITGLSDDDWMNTTSGAYAIYPHSQVEGINSDAEMVEAYGILYNWHAVNDERGLCPEGWRVPSSEDWDQLRNFISGGGQQGGHQLKSCRQKNSPLGGDCDTDEHPRWDKIVCNCNSFYADAFFMHNMIEGWFHSLGDYCEIEQVVITIGNGTLSYLWYFDSEGCSDYLYFDYGSEIQITLNASDLCNSSFAGLEVYFGVDYIDSSSEVEILVQAHLPGGEVCEYEVQVMPSGCCESTENYMYYDYDEELVIVEFFNWDWNCPLDFFEIYLDNASIQAIELMSSECDFYIYSPPHDDFYFIDIWELCENPVSDFYLKISIEPGDGFSWFNFYLIYAFGSECPFFYFWDDDFWYSNNSETNSGRLKNLKNSQVTMAAKQRSYLMDEYSFSGLPAGLRSYCSGTFFDLGTLAEWWSTSLSLSEEGAKTIIIENEYKYLATGLSEYLNNGFSVRCVADIICPGEMRVCIDDEAFLLTGAFPEGGVYSGVGVSDGFFDPSEDGEGTFMITYTYAWEGDGEQSCQFMITVNPLPQVTLDYFDAVCINYPAFALTGGLPEGGSYAGTGVDDNGLFDPSDAGAGTHEIIYTYTDENGCTNTATAEITVNDLPFVSCADLDQDVCLDAEPFALNGATPQGGTYSGSGASESDGSYIFNPAAAGPGIHEITYTFTDENGCKNHCTFMITVLSDDIPEILILNEHIVTQEQTVCHDAVETIITGGNDGWFHVQNGGNATLIAGQNILMLPGTTVWYGGYLLARIAENEDDFCGIPRAIEIYRKPLTSKEDVLADDFLYEIRQNGFFKLYPNPTEGTFTLEMTADVMQQTITAEVFSMRGELVFSKELPPQSMHILSLEGQHPGIYIIRVFKGSRIGLERIMKR